MPLTAEELNRIMVEVATGKPPSNTSDEANEARKKIEEEMAEIKKQGGQFQVPND